jgi:DNA-binding NarL/FixJ family response regulator
MSTSPRPPIRILLISGLEIIRAGLRKVIDESPSLKVVQESESCGAAAVHIGEQPDVILFDCDFCANHCLSPFPDAKDCAKSSDCADTCLDTLPKLLATRKGARALILTAIRNPVLYHQALRLGAMGLVFKEEPVEVLYEAIRKVNAGEFWLNGLDLASVFTAVYPTGRGEGGRPEAALTTTLTGREREVIGLTCEGLKNKQIAERLFISEATVHHHLTSIYDKLGVSGRFKLMVFAYQNGLIGPPGTRPN